MTPRVTYEACGDGAETLIFLHGIGGGATNFSPQLETLSTSRRVVAWNMPGYGGSPLVEGLTFPQLAGALERLMDEIGAGKADLFGHSIGGMVAQEFVLTRPSRVRTLTLCATTSAFGSRDGSFQEQFLAARLGPLDAGKTMSELAESFVTELIGADPSPEDVARARAGMAAIPPAAYREAIRCLVTFDRRSDLARINVPTLLIAGERDTSAPARTMARMAEKISRARFVEIPGAGHLLPVERPDEVGRLTAEFLQTIEGETP